MIRTPATTIATATTSAVIESKATIAGDLDQEQADEHADRGQRVGAQVGGVALERRRVVGAGLAREDVETTRLATTEKAITAMPTPSDSTSAPIDQPAGRLEDDDPGADQDQHPLDRGGEALDLLVAVGVVGVGRLVGLADRDEGDHRGDQVDQRVDRLGEDRDRAGDRAGGELERDQGRVGGDRERRRRRSWCGSSLRRRRLAAGQVSGQQPGRAAAVADRVLLGLGSARPSCARRRDRCRRGRRPGRSRSRPRPRGSLDQRPLAAALEERSAPSASTRASAQT